MQSLIDTYAHNLQTKIISLLGTMPNM